MPSVTLLGILIQALIQNAISKRRSQEDYTKLVVQFRADIVKEELSLIRACASELLADFDVVYNLISEQDWKSIEPNKIQELFFEISKKTNRIGLSLSLKEPNHKHAYDAIRDLYTISQEYSLVYSVNNIRELGEGYKKEFNRLENKYGATRHHGLIGAIENTYIEKQDEIILQLATIFDESWQRIGQDGS